MTRLDLTVRQLSAGLGLDPIAGESDRLGLRDPEARGDADPLDLSVADHVADRSW